MNLKENKMKKIFIAVCIVLGLSGCGNMDMFDTNFTFNKAYVHWPDGTMKVIDIKQWSDYAGEQIQIIGKDGNIYLVNSVNSVLVRE